MSEIRKKNVDSKQNHIHDSKDLQQSPQTQFLLDTTPTVCKKPPQKLFLRDLKICQFCRGTGLFLPMDSPCVHKLVQPKLPFRQPLLKHNEKSPSKRERSLPSQIPDVVYDYGCNECNDQIRGLRYHCNECPDYDACEECYKKVGHRHELQKVAMPCNQTVMSKSFQKEMLLKYLKTNVKVRRPF